MRISFSLFTVKSVITFLQIKKKLSVLALEVMFSLFQSFNRYFPNLLKTLSERSLFASQQASWIFLVRNPKIPEAAKYHFVSLAKKLETF